MTVKTCLLVTDDPDDHQAFSEALTEISERTVVLNILDSQKALSLLLSKRYAPDYIFLDLSMHGIRINTFLKSVMADTILSEVPMVVYGEQASISKIDGNFNNIIFFNKDFEYSELKDFLKKFFTPA
jgi:CheY-like chemotaxis protein